MRLSYKLTNVCGTVYKCGNVVFTPDGNCLISPVGNRVTVFDLVEHKSVTLDIETRSNISRIAVSNSGRLLICIDEDGHSVVINLHRKVLVHRFNFKEKVRDVQFSPDDAYLAVAAGRKVQVWRAPGVQREFMPFIHHRTYTGHYDDVTSVTWSPSGRFIASGSKDMTVRLHALLFSPGFVPVTLAGHRNSVVGVFFGGEGDVLYSVSKDGAAFVWEWSELPALPSSALPPLLREAGADEAEDGGESKPAPKSVAFLKSRSRFHAVPDPCADDPLSFSILKGEWRLITKHFFKQDNAKVYSCSFHRSSGLLVVGFSTGIFGIYNMPECTVVHTLSISQHRIHSATINPSGEWLAFGSRSLGQLLVWEWQSESYILKQQGHFHDLNTVAYSADGSLIATGGDDGKVKLWNTSSGFCFLTFTEHEGPVADIAFVTGKGGRGNSVISASFDGTVRAYDLTRYRNYRTLLPPAPAQFISLAVDSSGEVVCAGAKEPFDIFVWSLQTGKVLDVFSGHQAPVCGLAFSPTNPVLASCSWDKTIRLWDVYRSGAGNEIFTNSSDVLSVAFRPDGQQLCGSLRDGQLVYWDVKLGTVDKLIEAGDDVTAGRRKTDFRTAATSARGKCFSSVAYSADGSCTLAGGLSRFVCIYAIAPRLLLRKFQLSHNRSLDGTLDKLNSAMEGLPEDSLSEEDRDERPDSSLPGVVRGDYVSRRVRQEIRSKCVRFSPSGTSFAVATTDGLVIFSQDASLSYVPFELSEDVTPDAVRGAIRDRSFTTALVMALHLNLRDIIVEAISAIPASEVEVVSASVPRPFLQLMFEVVSGLLTSSPQVELLLRWSLALLQHHGEVVSSSPLSSSMASSLRSVQKAIASQSETLGKLCDDNTYTLDFLSSTVAHSAALHTM